MCIIYFVHSSCSYNTNNAWQPYLPLCFHEVKNSQDAG